MDGNKVWYKHFPKEMSNHLLMLEISAMPARVKRATLTQEVITIRRNIRPDLPWEVTTKHLNKFCQRMKASGYNENYRLQILKAGMTGYDRMLEVERAGGRPVNQPRSWDEDNRQKKKALQSKTWFRKGGFDVPLFVPCTPGGELAKRMTRMEA